MTLGYRTSAAVCAVLLTAGGPDLAAQTRGAATPPLVIGSMAGQDLFLAYCAPCHGRGGRGDGPTAPALRTAMPDLTTLQRRNGGAFSSERLTAVVTHGEALASPAHGSREMPTWGPIFRALDPDDTRARVRISAIVDWLAAIQRK